MPHIIAHSEPGFLLVYVFIITYFLSIIIINYTRDQLFSLRPFSGNTICLAMCPRRGKHGKQFESDASNLINVPITPYNSTDVQNVSIGLINYYSICNKSDDYRDLADW